MSAAFTPGPWRVYSDRDDELKVKGPGDEWIADCADGFWGDDGGDWIMAAESEANARLIAAAPDLLAALQNILGMAEAHTNRCKALRHNKGKPVIEAMQADIAAARAAIAKAEGAS